jgi:hypothetical protein
LVRELRLRRPEHRDSRVLLCHEHLGNAFVGGLLKEADRDRAESDDEDR